ncbi:hypothetical protein COY23_00930 [bacterium (Candidatus Torokbacteria) CG_4_10_14_0_2_um_filter_35_8]|nr:MAG: hypothetical protein COY23_00930 [bacterium (Candidatus Torokbacteria) CG_4_10_14_0_2_um_filter_35_8]
MGIEETIKDDIESILDIEKKMEEEDRGPYDLSSYVDTLKKRYIKNIVEIAERHGIAPEEFVEYQKDETIIAIIKKEIEKFKKENRE